MNATQTYPVRLEGAFDANVSRWLWLVKWLLVIPHYIVLTLLWLALFVLTVVAFFAILFTRRYPRGIFDFNVGVLRWTWRVAFYSYGALGTDRYPPFTLGDVSEYPARLEVTYPDQLSRGLVLVKWWLLAIPHYIVVALIIGSGGYAASEAWSFGFEIGLVGALVLFAGFALLFTARYPRGIFDFVVGLDRWVARVAAYVLLMRDEYPPFRLEQGGAEAVALDETPPSVAPKQESNRSGGGRRRHVALILTGVVAGVVAFALLAGGCALIAIDRTQRDDEGFLMSTSDQFSTPTHAIVSETADVDLDGAERLLQRFIGTVRVRSESDRAVFVGIGPASDVERYIDGVEHDIVTDLDEEPRYSRESGGAPVTRPDEETFWVQSVAGPGTQILDVNLEDGDWRVVVMNDDATRNVSSAISIGAEFNAMARVGIGLLVVGGVLLAGAALALVAGIRRRVRAAPAVAVDVS